MRKRILSCCKNAQRPVTGKRFSIRTDRNANGHERDWNLFLAAVNMQKNNRCEVLITYQRNRIFLNFFSYFKTLPSQVHSIDQIVLSKKVNLLIKIL